MGGVTVMHSRTKTFLHSLIFSRKCLMKNEYKFIHCNYNKTLNTFLYIFQSNLEDYK